LTQLYAQIGVSKDTIRCYGITELRLIARTAVDLNTCDTLLSIAKSKITNRQALIEEQRVEISKFTSLNQVKDEVIVVRDNTIKDQKKEIKKLSRRLLWAKIGWVATAVAEAGLIIYVLFH